MAVDEIRASAADMTWRPTTTADDLLRIATLSEAESRDITAFLAPGRLRVMRRLMAGLLRPLPLAGPAPGNDN